MQRIGDDDDVDARGRITLHRQILIEIETAERHGDSACKSLTRSVEEKVRDVSERILDPVRRQDRQ